MQIRCSTDSELLMSVPGWSLTFEAVFNSAFRKSARLQQDMYVQAGI